MKEAVSVFVHDCEETEMFKMHQSMKASNDPEFEPTPEEAIWSMRSMTKADFADSDQEQTSAADSRRRIQ